MCVEPSEMTSRLAVLCSITLLGVELHGFRWRKAQVMVCGNGILGGARLKPSKPKYLLRTRVAVSLAALPSCALSSAEAWLIVLLGNAGCAACAHLHPVLTESFNFIDNLRRQALLSLWTRRKLRCGTVKSLSQDSLVGDG